MSFEVRDLVVLNLVVVTLVVASYWFLRRGARAPVRLNLRNPPSSVDSSVAPRASVRNFSRTEYRPRAGNPALRGQTSDPPPLDNEGPHTVEETTLNVLFNWNGHTWDAYEVLGIPAGSSWAAVETAFTAVRARVDAQSVAFVTAAYQAISQRHPRRK